MGQKSFREPTTVAHLKKLADWTGITPRIFESPAVYTSRGLNRDNTADFREPCSIQNSRIFGEGPSRIWATWKQIKSRTFAGDCRGFGGPETQFADLFEPDSADLSSTERRGELPAVVVNKVSLCELSVGAQKYAHRGIARRPHAFNMCVVFFF